MRLLWPLKEAVWIEIQKTQVWNRDYNPLLMRENRKEGISSSCIWDTHQGLCLSMVALYTSVQPIKGTKHPTPYPDSLCPTSFPPRRNCCLHPKLLTPITSLLPNARDNKGAEGWEFWRIQVICWLVGKAYFWFLGNKSWLTSWRLLLASAIICNHTPQGPVSRVTQYFGKWRACWNWAFMFENQTLDMWFKKWWWHNGVKRSCQENSY